MARAISADNVYVHISADKKECVETVVERIVSLIKNKPTARISFAAGQTFIPIYEALAEKVKRDKIDCSQIECFQLDEYYPCSPTESFSFVKYLKKNVMRPLFLSESQFHFFDGEASDVDAEVIRFQSLLHDIDLSIQGVGPGGHIAFNESGSDFDSRTRVVDLAQETIDRDHQERGLNSPTQALTQGIADIIEANQVFLIALGEKKAEVIRQTLRDPVSIECPASALRIIPQKVHVFLDEAAAQLL